jgi:hypothetical protein
MTHLLQISRKVLDFSGFAPISDKVDPINYAQGQLAAKTTTFVLFAAN